MKSRIATIFTMVLLVAGAGGAIAIGASGSHSSVQGGAASGQYKPGKGCGDKNHKHSRRNQCKKPPKHNCGKHHNKKCPTPQHKKHKAKHHKAPPKHPASSKCTIRHEQHGLTVVYCP